MFHVDGKMEERLHMVIANRTLMTPYQAMDTAMIQKYNRVYGKKSACGALYLLLVDLVNTYRNVSVMGEEDAAEVAAHIVDNFGHITLSEFAVFCEGCKNGKYGKVYNRFDRPVFFEMWDKYLEAREGYLMDKRQKEKGEDAKNFFAAMKEKAPEVFQELSNTLEKPYKALQPIQENEYLGYYPADIQAEIKREKQEKERKDRDLKNSDQYRTIEKLKEEGKI